MDRPVSDDFGSVGQPLLVAVLEHHGIKGMKWGHRKGSSSSDSTSSKEPVSADHVVAEGHKQTIRLHGVKALSNNELRQLNERMQLEQNNRNLNSQNPSKFDKGQTHVDKVLKTGKKLSDIYNLVNSPAGKAARKAVLG